MSKYPGSLKASALRKLLVVDGFTYERTNQHGIQIYIRTRGNERTVINLHPTRDPTALDTRRIFAQAGWGPEGPAEQKTKTSTSLGEQLIHKARAALAVPSSPAVTQDSPKSPDEVDDDRKLEAVIYEKEHGTLPALNRFATTRTQLARWREEVGSVDREVVARPPSPAQAKPDLRLKVVPRRALPSASPVLPRPASTHAERMLYVAEIGNQILRGQAPWAFATAVRMRDDVRAIREGTHDFLAASQAQALATLWERTKKNATGTLRSPRYTLAAPAPELAESRKLVAHPSPPTKKETGMTAQKQDLTEIEELRIIVVEQSREIYRLKQQLAAKQ